MSANFHIIGRIAQSLVSVGEEVFRPGLPGVVPTKRNSFGTPWREDKYDLRTRATELGRRVRDEVAVAPGYADRDLQRALSLPRNYVREHFADVANGRDQSEDRGPVRFLVQGRAKGYSTVYEVVRASTRELVAGPFRTADAATRVAVQKEGEPE